MEHRFPWFSKALGSWTQGWGCTARPQTYCSLGTHMGRVLSPALACRLLGEERDGFSSGKQVQQRMLAWDWALACGTLCGKHGHKSFFSAHLKNGTHPKAMWHCRQATQPSKRSLCHWLAWWSQVGKAARAQRPGYLESLGSHSLCEIDHQYLGTKLRLGV